MNVFEAVKQSVTTRQAAETYGIRVNRNGMCVCPFHDDRTPSMKVDRRFHCFGCQADGDVIDFTAKLFDMNSKGAAVKLAADFGIPYEERTHDPPMPNPKPKISAELQFRKAESYCYRVLCEYHWLLEKWQTDYAPRTLDEEWHPLFVEALQRKNYVEYLLDDVFLTGSVEDKAAFIRLHGKDVTRLEKRIREFTASRAGGRDADDERDGEIESHTAPLRPQCRSAHRYDDRAL
ncbi:MAG: CHC2 zinc finger domain-containing protein [Clostridiales bacterium]|nr:CHC2 zinc finger domain-containing protein [Clostridiales bacterium]